MIRLGMSGFSYPEWIGEIYPPGTKRKDMLAAYADIFNAVEINMSFRRTPEPKTIDTWREAVPATFLFSMKANQRITHWKRLVDTKDDVAEFVKVAQCLRTKLGPVLFQTRATTKFDESVFDAFCADLVPGCLYAFEPRDASFMGPEAQAAMKRHGIALCLNDDLFEPSTYELTGPFAYFRFHKEGSYGPGDLEARADLVKRLAENVDVYTFFAHEDDPESVKPALRFQKLIS